MRCPAVGGIQYDMVFRFNFRYAWLEFRAEMWEGRMLKEKILVADDEQSMREFLEIMLKKEGYKISLAPNGEEVIKLVEKDIFDLILMDIRMPRLDGISTLKKIKAISPKKIVIIF